jgi:hypothetical protein
MSMRRLPPPSTNVGRYNFFDPFRPNVQLRETGQTSARNAVNLEKVDLPGGEWWAGKKLEQPRLNLGQCEWDRH